MKAPRLSNRQIVAKAAIVGICAMLGAKLGDLAVSAYIWCLPDGRCSWSDITWVNGWDESGATLYGFYAGMMLGTLAGAIVVVPPLRQLWALVTAVLALVVFPIALYAPVAFLPATITQRFAIAALLAGSAAMLCTYWLAHHRSA